MDQPKAPQHLTTVTEMPYNAETPLSALLDEVTASELVYVRNHFEAPVIDASDWSLRVDGLVEAPQSLPHSAILAMPSQTLRMTLECAGNARKSMNPLPGGTIWGYGAVSSVEFTGTPLSNVLDLAGVLDGAVEVVFHGADKGEAMPGRTEAYVRSLPLEVALRSDTLLAWELNGEPLSVGHGYPLRLVVPGWYGMASVKWLNQISVSQDKFSGFFQNEQYVYSEERGTPEGEPVRLIRVRSLIVDATLNDQGNLEILGIAWTGDGTISKVEVSMDGGEEWFEAELDGAAAANVAQRWRYTLKSNTTGPSAIASRATDSAGNQQPRSNIWNRGGYGNNGPQVVEVPSMNSDGE